MSGNSWQNILDTYTEKLLLRSSIKDVDPIDFCLDNKEIRQFLSSYISKFSAFKNEQRMKNDAKSMTKRLEGNEKFSIEDYEESRLCYTQSIFYATSDGECLPLAYSNRSSSLFQLGYYKECIQDIDLAIKYGYPKNNVTKLLLRKGTCFSNLQKFEEAIKVLQDAMNNISKQCSDGQDKYKRKIRKELSRIKNIKKESSKESSINELPELKGGENENFAFASKYLNVVFSENKGRHVIAQKDFEIGDVLFVEKPFAFVVLKDICHNCCTETFAPIPCNNCIDLFYCSEKCRDTYWNEVHKYECGYYEFLKCVGIAHLGLIVPLRAADKFDDLNRIVQQIKHSQPKTKQNGIIQYKDLQYENVYNLVTHLSDIVEEDLFQYALTACLLSVYLQDYTDYFSRKSEEDLKVFASLVLRHIAQLICNGHAISSLSSYVRDKKSSVDTEYEERVGTAIYPSASMMNHSCDPSIINCFYGNWLIVRASKAIKKGEEVFNCYGPHCKRHQRTERQEILSKQYFFQCQCPPCTSLFDIQDVLLALKCCKCGGPVSSSSTKSSRELPLVNPCRDCGQFEEILDKLIIKDQILNLIEEGEYFIEREEIQLALNKFLESWKLARSVLYKYNKHLIYAADQVAKCLAIMKEHDRSIAFLKCAVLAVENNFGPLSIELGIELQKLGDIMLSEIHSDNLKDCSKDSRNKINSAIEVHEKAKKIFRLLFGKEHPYFKEAAARIDILKSFEQPP